MIEGAAAGSGSIGRAAIDAALRDIRARAKELSGEAAAYAAPSTDFARTLQSNVAAVDHEVRAADALHLRTIRGELEFHEVTSQLKRSELAFEFAMQVRNKLIDAYREVMRMSV